MANTFSNFEINAASKRPTMTRPRSARIYFLLPIALIALGLSLLTLAVHAATVRTLDGKSLEGDLRFNDAGALVLTPAEGKPITIELKDVARATFASGSFFSSGSVLPNGWAAQDIGDSRGLARLDTNTFALRVEGHSTNGLACHFVSRPMPTDGDIIVRVDEIGGNGIAHAGLMIRGDNSSTFAALSLGNDGRLWFHRRPDSEKKDIRLTSGPKASAPVMLRLQKNEKSLTAMYALDGKTWQTLATEPFKLSAVKTWREGEGELQLLRASCGVFASSRAANTLATARVTPLAMMLHGLLGEYFADQNFINLRMARLDPQIRFSWNSGSPDPSLARDNFSVRWTGKLIAPKAGVYQFYFDADDRARLWIDEKEISPASLKKHDKQPPPTTISFLGGVRANLKMEFENGEGAASAKLGWGLQGQTPDVINMTNFLYVFAATNSPESIAQTRATNNGPAVRGVMLRNGTFIASPVTKADESAVRLTFAGKKDVPVLNSKIARIYLKPARQRLPFEITQGRTGVFMKNGDFLESEFGRIEGSALYMGSVLFGSKKFWIESGDPLAVVLNDCILANSGFEVRLLDGSAVRTPRLAATAQTITLEEQTLGSFSVPTAELFEIRALGSPGAANSTSNR